MAALLLLLSCEGLQTAIADGETRTISMHHLHTGEDITVTFKRDGRYNEDALKKLNWFLRDWRRNEQIRMDPRLIDLLWEVQHDLHVKDALQIVCGYRAPETNAMLRRRSGGVAQFSQHMLGKAIDFYIPDAPLDDLRVVGLRLQRGGVGYYPTSGSPFVHLDVGSVRHWPRMTREQLVKVFPDGRTVHVPSDGHPLAGYALALADIERRGNEPSATSLEAARNEGVLTAAEPSLFARLFGARKAKDEDEDAEAVRTAAAQTVAAAAPRAIAPAAVPAAEKTERPAAVASLRLPLPRPAFRIASVPAADSVTAAAPAQAKQATPAAGAAAAPSPNDVIAVRGYWQGLPDSEPAPAPVKVAARTPTAIMPAKVENDSADPVATGTLTPWRDAPRAGGERGPELALAYAAEPNREATRVAPMGSSLARTAPVAPASSLAIKQSDRPAIVQPLAAPAPARAASAPVKAGQADDQPWLRAVMLTPSTAHYLTTTLLGANDYRSLRRFLEKPSSTVTMAFSDDPHRGLTTAQFSGKAVVFTATVLFNNRTASLQP
jgi:uncharacterized protein YcbK (DUF882 family)